MKFWIFLAAILTVVTPPTQRTTEKIVFLVDKSGSMDAAKMAIAIEQFISVVTNQDPSLDVEICMISFESKTERWKYGWQKMPSMSGLKAAKDFLSIPPMGSTAVIPGIRRALAEHKKKLTVIVITDGMFDESTPEVLKAIHEGQVARVLRGKPMAVIGCIGIGVTKSKSLKAIAKAGHGGYYDVESKKKLH